MYIFAVALEDGKWHHINSYTKKRSNRKSTINLWHKIKTHEDRVWTKKYHHPDPKKRSFGGKIILKMIDGTKIKKVVYKKLIKHIKNLQDRLSNHYIHL